jgi:hypothetical protein
MTTGSKVVSINIDLFTIMHKILKRFLRPLSLVYLQQLQELFPPFLGKPLRIGEHFGHDRELLVNVLHLLRPQIFKH